MNRDPERLRQPKETCVADPRNESFSILSEEGLRPKTLDDHYRNVSEILLHDKVPDGIRIQFDTTRNLYLYAWFVYRFYPVARGHAYTCLEYALRERFEAEMVTAGTKGRLHGPGLRKLLDHASKTGHLRNEHFENWRRRAKSHAHHRTMIEQIKETQRSGLKSMTFDERAIEIKEVDRDFDYVATLIASIPALRNHYAHGSRSLDNQALGAIQVTAEIINQIFPSKSAPRDQPRSPSQ
jgi:hypothetical protein